MLVHEFLERSAQFACSCVLVEVHDRRRRQDPVCSAASGWPIIEGAAGAAGAKPFDPAAAFVDLHGGDRLGHVAIAPLERVEQHPLVGEGDIAKGGIGAQPRTADVLAAKLEGAEDGAQRLVSRRVTDERLELAVQECDLAGVRGRFELIDNRMHLGQVVCRHALCGESGRGWEQQPANFEHFFESLRLQELHREHHARQQLAGSETCHVGSIASSNVEHVDLGERAHRLAQRPPRHAEPFGQLVLGRQPVAWAQVAGADHRPNAVDRRRGDTHSKPPTFRLSASGNGNSSFAVIGSPRPKHRMISGLARCEQGTMVSNSLDAIKRVIEAFERSQWSEIDVRSGNVRVHLSASAPTGHTTHPHSTHRTRGRARSAGAARPPPAPTSSSRRRPASSGVRPSPASLRSPPLATRWTGRRRCALSR